MRAFSQLLDDLVYTRSRNTKLRLIGDYLKETPDPDRGYGLAALTGTLDIPAVKPAAVRSIAEERVDPVLLYMSRDYVGDMAETVSLLWPTSATGVPETDDATIRISDAVERLRLVSRLEAPRALASTSRKSRRSGTDLRRPLPSCSTGRKAERPSRRCATCRCSAPSCSRTR
jgi:DNA ligase-1